MYKPEEVAQKAYETFTRSTINQNAEGNAHPRWEDLPEAQQKAWLGVVHEVTTLINSVESRTHATKKDDETEHHTTHKKAHAAR